MLGTRRPRGWPSTANTLRLNWKRWHLHQVLVPCCGQGHGASSHLKKKGEKKGKKQQLLFSISWVPLKLHFKPAEGLSWLERCPARQKVVGLIPRQGTHLGCGSIWVRVPMGGRKPTDVSLSHQCFPLSLSLPLSLKLSRHILGWGLKSKF